MNIITKEELQQVMREVENEVLLTDKSTQYYKRLLKKTNGDVEKAKLLMDLDFAANRKKYSKAQEIRKQAIEQRIVSQFNKAVLRINALLRLVKDAQN